MKLNKYTYMVGLALAALTTACEDQDTEITSVDYDRLFAPIGVEARVINKTDVRLTWTPASGVTGYNIELFANDSLTFVGSPVSTYSVDVDENPYVITALEGETKYSARLQAICEDASMTSKWSGVYFKTDAEQLFKALGENDLTATSVILSWTAGRNATEIILQPGNIKHTVTSAEVAAGQATIEGLTPETQYTATLKNGEKTCGEITFETLIDLGGATAVYPEDDFAQVIADAEDGAVLALFPGTYQSIADDGTQNKIVLNKSIEFKAVRPNDRPIINACFQIKEGANSVSLKQVILDGTGSDGAQTFDYKSGTAFKALILEDCEVKNYTKGLYYLNIAAAVDEITINNCLIHDIVCDGGDLMDSRKGAIKVLTISNSTFYNTCKGRDFVRYDDAASSFADISAPQIIIDHCTIDGVTSESNSRRLFYVRYAGNVITFTNNIVSNTIGNFSNQSKTNVPTFKGNNYFNAAGLNTAGGSGLFIDETGTTYDPGYKDAANGDFSLSHEELIYNKVGDPRWF
ncbi:MAG: fibronectin type III domain-containing protein [Bacteroides sp.]|nr:fibronectin type III domain-containing protein [Bacteroides sp.]